MKWKGLNLALAVSVLGACHTPLIRTDAATLESEDDSRYVDERPGVVKQIVLYLPNRVVDLCDIVHAGVPLDVPIGIDIRITRWMQLAALAGAGVSVGWDDRSHQPAWANVRATAAIGPYRTGAGTGNAPSVGDWEIAVAGSAVKFAIDLEEIADFVLGIFFVDFKEDDYGWE